MVAGTVVGAVVGGVLQEICEVAAAGLRWRGRLRRGYHTWALLLGVWPEMDDSRAGICQALALEGCGGNGTGTHDTMYR